MDPYVMSKLTLLKQWPVKKWFNEVKLLLIKQTSNIPLPYQWSSRKHVEAKVQGFKWKKERLDLWTSSSKFPHLIVFPLPIFLFSSSSFHSLAERKSEKYWKSTEEALNMCRVCTCLLTFSTNLSRIVACIKWLKAIFWLLINRKPY